MDQARGEAPAQWRRVRRLLNEHRTALAAMAAGLYPDLPRVAGTDLLCWPGWLPATPLDLADVPLSWVTDPPPPAVAGTGAATAHVLPRTGTGQAYPTYAAAIEALDRPALFENRVCYRLLDADLASVAGPARSGQAIAAGTAVRPVPLLRRGEPGRGRGARADRGLGFLLPPCPALAACRCGPRWVIRARCRAAPRSPPSPP